MSFPEKRRKAMFPTVAIALHVPRPKGAGRHYDTDAINTAVETIGNALHDTSGAPFNHHANVSCESFKTYMRLFIDECREADPKPSQAVVYVCTHGVVNQRTGELHLMMSDSPDPSEGQLFYERSISGEVLRDCMAQLQDALPDGKVWLLLESCYSGALAYPDPRPPATLGGYTSGRFNKEARDAVKEGTGIVYFMSCGATELSQINQSGPEASWCPFFTKAVAQTMMSFPPGEGIPMVRLVSETCNRIKEELCGKQKPCVYPDLRYIEYGNTGTVPVDTLDEVEAMEVDPYESSVLGTGSKDMIQFIPEGSSPEEVKMYYEKQKNALKDLSSAVMSVNAPVEFRNAIEKVEEKWENFTFEECKRLVLCGQTGDGKSTLLNALVEAEVLPAASCGVACTLAVSEVCIVNMENAMYKTEVEFLSHDECKDVLQKIWQSSLLEGDENDDPEQKDADIYQSPEDAFNDLEAMFDDEIPSSPEEMLNHKNIKSYICKGFHKIVHENPEDMKSELEDCVSRLHPLVKKIKFYVPTEKVPKNMILVDIPGHHDSNLVRERIADEQIKDADIIWVVATIGRAASNETPQFLVSKVMEGNIARKSTLAFVCTQNDDKCEDLPKNMKSIFRKYNDPQMKKIQENMQDLFQKCKGEKDKEQCQLLKTQWRLLYARWRGLKVEKDLHQKFQTINRGNWKASVFAVSAKDYLRLLRDETPAVFTKSEDTGIPKLQKVLHEIVNKHHHLKVEEFCHENACLYKKLECEVGLTKKDQKEQQWEKNVEALLDSVKKITDQFQDGLISGDLKAIEKATKEKIKTFPERINKVLDKCRKMPWNTLRATLENNGSFVSKKTKKIVISDDLAKDMVECVAEDWNNEFNTILEKLQKFETDWIAEDSVVSQGFETLHKIKPGVVWPCVALFRGKMLYVVSTLTDVFNDTAKSAIANISDQCQKALTPLYDEWREKGGTHYRKKEDMIAFVKEKLTGDIGKCVIEGVEAKLERALRSVQHNIKGELDTFKDGIKEMLVEGEVLSDVPPETKQRLIQAVTTFKSNLKSSFD